MTPAEYAAQDVNTLRIRRQRLFDALETMNVSAASRIGVHAIALANALDAGPGLSQWTEDVMGSLKRALRSERARLRTDGSVQERAVVETALTLLGQLWTAID